MDTTIRVREEPATCVAYLRREGPYARIPDALQALHRHLSERGLTPAGPPVGVFFTDPREVPAEQARWEVRWPIAERPPDAPPDEGRVGVRTLGSRSLAILVRTGPYDTIAQDYARAVAWIAQHGYQVIGPSEEAYLSEPDTPPDEIRTEIRFPVASAPAPPATDR